MQNWEEVRMDFKVAGEYLYLDNAAKVPLTTQVAVGLDAFNYACRHKGRDYQKWWKRADRVRRDVANLIGGKPEEIAYAGSATQAVNIIAQGLTWNEGDNVVVAESEFPSNLYPWLALAAQGVEVRLVKEDESGELPLQRYKELCDDKTRLLAVSHVQAGNGYRINLTEFGEFCDSRDILFMVDATQSCGIFPIDTEKMKIDFLCASTYKWMMGTDGLAILYCRMSRLPLIRFTYLGWSGRTERNDYEHHEMDFPNEARKFELGNLNFTAITALYFAMQYQKSIGTENIMGRTMSLVEHLKKGLRSMEGVTLVGDFKEQNTGAPVTFICNNFAQVHERLQERKVLCTLRFNGIRFSPYIYNTYKEIDQALSILKECMR